MLVGRTRLDAAILGALLIGVLAVPAAALAQDGDPTAEPTARMRFLAGHRFGPTDLLVGGEPVYEGLDYGAITDYVDVPAGAFVLEADGPQSTEASVDLEAAGHYTAVLVPVEGGVELAVVADRPKPKAGKAQVRVVSLCAECGPIRYDALYHKKALAKTLDYGKGKRAGKYVPVKAGPLQLVAAVRGADDALADFDPLDIAPGTSHSLFVVGQDPSAVMLVPALDAAITSARFLNASREPYVVDVYVDGKRMAKRIYPGQAATKPSQLLAGEHLVQVVEAGQEPADGTIHEGVVDFPAGAVAVEAVAGESLEAVPMPTSRATKPRTSRIRFAHVDPEIPAVDIELRGMEPVLGLEPGSWTDYLTVPGNSSYAWIRPSDDPASIYHELPLDLGPNQNVTAYLGGSPQVPTVELVIVSDPVAKGKKK